MSDLIGQTLGEYRIVELIGAGGMGEVYRAYDPRLDREVAIKVLPERVAKDADRLARFHREARAVAKLAHPNILEIWDFGSEDGVTYAVMELLEGSALSKLIPPDGLSWQRAVEIGAAIADGLAAAHAKGVVHRDLKPDNLFVTSDGRVKVLDFGLARLDQPVDTEGETRSEAPALTGAGTVLGTVGFMSPEQVRGEPADHRSDIFSLGCVLYGMVAGRGPFKRETAPDSMAAVLREEPRRLSELAESIPPELERTVIRCLEKNPSARFQSTADLAFALRSISPGGDQPSAMPEVKGRGLGWPWIGAAATVAVLLVLAGVLLVPRAREGGGSARTGEIDAIAVLPLENLTGDSEEDYFAMGMTEALIADLARIKALRVISRQSVERFKDTDTPLPEIAATLGVDAVVEGSVLRAGNQVRITTQLIRADPEEHLWAESYQRELEDILALQSEVARRIAREIKVTVTAQEESRLAHASQVDPEAHELYLRARSFSSRGVHQESIELYNRAIAKDPGFALAYAGLAEQEVFHLPSKEMMPAARAHALKALAIDPDLAEARAVLALAKLYFDWDWHGAEQDFLEAIELGPASATAHHRYSFYLTAMKRFSEAREELRTARALDPLNAFISVDLARTFYYERLFDQAIDGYDAILELNPDFYWALLLRGFALEQMERYREAAASLIEARLSVGDQHMAEGLRKGFERGGYDGFLRAWANHWGTSPTRAQPTSVAMVKAKLGDVDAAIEWLERGYDERTRYMINLDIEPQFDSLRSDPRFQDILRRMNFPGL
jgi:TolB-like protein/Tfp pilus assembly protein PilF